MARSLISSISPVLVATSALAACAQIALADWNTAAAQGYQQGSYQQGSYQGNYQQGYQQGYQQRAVASPNSQQRPRVIYKPYNNDNENVAEELKQPPDLPYLPPYSGEMKFDRILSYTRARFRPSYSLTFAVKEEPQQVMNFYRDAFRQNRWSINEKSSNNLSLYATRGDAICNVYLLSQAPKGKFKTHVYLQYKIYSKSK